MPIQTRVEPLSRDIDLIISQELSPAARSAALAQFARETLAEAQDVNRRAMGRVPAHETTVDGRRGAAVESVKPEGRVDFEFDLARDMFIFIDLELARLSPRLTGRYLANHKFFADGREVNPASAPDDAKEYVFTNLAPYARVIEAGAMKMRAPGTSMVYQQAAKLARQRFGNLARIRFGYRGGGSRSDRQPAIIITF